MDSELLENNDISCSEYPNNSKHGEGKMKWRTNREGLVSYDEYLCEIDGTYYEVLMCSDNDLSCGEHDIAWASDFVYRDNQITKWCPLSEIVEFLNAGDSSDEY